MQKISYVKNCNIFGQILIIWVKLMLKKISIFFQFNFSHIIRICPKMLKFLTWVFFFSLLNYSNLVGIICPLFWLTCKNSEGGGDPRLPTALVCCSEPRLYCTTCCQNQQTELVAMSSGKCNLVFKIQSPSISWICTVTTLVFSDFLSVTKVLVSWKRPLLLLTYLALGCSMPILNWIGSIHHLSR